MAEYKLQGLSCANCAREMEEEIQKLDHGKDAKILFNSSKLIVSDDIAIHKVEKILAGDGAALVKETCCETSDEHDHSHGAWTTAALSDWNVCIPFYHGDSY